jgi:holo-[acyl-carrier protein] synthase
MIHSNGVDLVEVARVERALREHGERFLARVYTAGERAYCLAKARPGPSLAARFAAKEAVMKCLGTGWSDGVGFAQIEVVRDRRGAPSLVLHGRAAERARELGIRRWHLSLTHTEHGALAFAIAEGDIGRPAV